MGGIHPSSTSMLSALGRLSRRTPALSQLGRVAYARNFATVFTSDHEWVTTLEDGVISTGITDFAQNQLGDVVYVELPEVGDTFDQGDSMGVVESVKAANDVFAPVSGEIVEINEELPEEPSVINSDPTGAGWWVKIKMSVPEELDELMDDDSYAAFCEENE